MERPARGQHLSLFGSFISFAKKNNSGLRVENSYIPVSILESSSIWARAGAGTINIVTLLESWFTITRYAPISSVPYDRNY
jgi:hypothetical protein